MYRGTTPTHKFKTDLDLSDAEVVYLTYLQGSRRLEKTKEDLKFTEDGFEVKLTQEETLRFSKVGNVRLQIRARFADGSAVACKVIETTAGEILKDGVI